MKRCPNCRYNLDHKQDPEARVGDLTVSLHGDCWWKGQRVPLSGGMARLVYLLAVEAGVFTPTPVLRKEVSSSEKNGTLRVVVTQTRNRFRAIDPAFDRIEGRQSRGFRWRVD